MACQRYGPPTDVWSLGCVAKWQIGLGNEPHDDSPEMALLLVRSVRSAALFLASEEAEASRRLAAILIQDSARPTAKDVTLIAQRLSNSAPSGFTGVLLVFSVSDICANYIGHALLVI